MQFRRQNLFWILLPLWLAACGGTSDSPSMALNDQSDETEHPAIDMEAPETGVFVDSPVQGLSFVTASQQGFTDENGEFSFLPGEEILFSIGNLVLPPVVAMAEISPYDIFGTNDIYNPSALNLARLLQSLDVDGDANNGIEIPAAAHSAFTLSDVDFSGDTFDEEINPILVNIGGAHTALISEEDASDHLFMSLGIEVEQGCGSDHPSVGTQVQFTTYFHDVSGVLTVTDNCTLTITNFVYDGEGPSVAFYSGVDGNYSSGQAISPTISGRAYSGGTITLNLPRGLSLDDFNSVSVWCYAFHANFGDAIF